ncbi:MAG TPA: hypothetical protein VGL40_02450 [Bacillota bacterium]
MPLRRHPGLALWIVLIVLVLSWSAAGPVAAAGQGGQPAGTDQSATNLKMTVIPGFGGQAKFGRWVPVEVVVTNTGPDVSGRVVIDHLEANSGYRTEYAVDAVVASGSKKAFLLHIPFTDLQHAIEARFISGADELASARAQMEAIPATDVTVGVLSDDPAALNYLGAITLDQKRRVTVVHLQPAQLSRHVGVLDNFDLLVLDNVDTQAISQDQWGAIEAWIGVRGTLAVAGGPNARKTLAGLPAALLPVEVDGTAPADLSPLAVYAGKTMPGATAGTVSKVKLKTGTTIEVGRTDLPLLVDARIAGGHLLFFSADLTLAPLADWGGTTALWTKLLATKVASASTTAASAQVLISSKMAPSGSVSLLGTPSVAYALRNLPVMDLPSMRLLGALLLIYVLIIGPLNYFILRRLDRRDWAWVTIPLVVVLFAGSAYVFAFKGKGRDVITNNLAIVRLDPGVPTARTQTYVGVFAPSRRAYRVSLAGDPLVAALSAFDAPPPVSSGAASGGAGPITTRISTGSSTTVEFTDMRMWSMQSFMVDRAVPSQGAIESNLRTGPNGLTGSVTNKTPFTLKDAFIVSDFGYTSLGDLGPGQTAPVDLKLTAVGGSAYGRPMLTQIMNQYNPKGTSTTVDRELNRRRMLLEAAFGWEREGRWDDDRVVVGGWVYQPIDQATVADKPGQDYYLAFVGSPAQVSFVDGKDLLIPDGLLRPTLIEAKSNTAAHNPDGYAFSDGSLTFEAVFPVVPRQLSSLIFWLPNAQNGPGTVALKTEVYDWAKKAWVAARLDTSTVDLGEGKGLVSPDGRVRLKVTNPGGVWFNLGEPMISARGKVK